MDKQALAKDFMEWSGGFPPESDHQITVYLDYALPAGFDRQEANEFLTDWYASSEDEPPQDETGSAV
jgi:hypothetical protein